MKISVIGCLIAMMFLAGSDFAQGQTFSARKFGTALSKQPAPGDTTPDGSANPTGVGSITGSERFLKNNRGVGSFVGLNPQQGFIGDNPASDNQANGPNSQSQVNIVVPQIPYNTPRGVARQNGPYEPKLVVGFDYDQAAMVPSGTDLQARLVKLNQERFGRIKAVVSKGTVHLTGQVSNSHDRDLAADLLAFEPGVVRVRNDLVVTSPLPPPPAPRSK